MSCHCCFTIFWTAKYNSPCTFCLASYSVMCHDQCCPASFPTAPSTINIAYEPLVATPRTNTLPFLIPINKLVLLWGRHHPFLSMYLGSPHLATWAFKHTFFPQHLRHCYIHPSYKWTLPRGSEQACLNELFLAMVCRHSIFGWVTPVILCKRRTAYGILNYPFILNIVEHTNDIGNWISLSYWTNFSNVFNDVKKHCFKFLRNIY